MSSAVAKVCKQIIKKTGLECGNKIKGDVAELCGMHMPREAKPKAPTEDKMTEDATRFLMSMFVDNAKREIEFTVRFGLKHRREGMSAELSENIIKYAIRNKGGDATCTWACEEERESVSSSEEVEEVSPPAASESDDRALAAAPASSAPTATWRPCPPNHAAPGRPATCW